MIGKEVSEPAFGEIRRIGLKSRDGVFVYDLTRKKFVYFNNALEKILEINKSVLSNDPSLVTTLLREDDREYVELRFRELLSNEILEDVQFRLVQNDVEKFVTCNAYISDEMFIVGFVRDVSRQKEHEEYLVNYGARKDTILDMVSQNLSTPLNLSRFTVDLLEKAVKEKNFDRLNGHISLMREVNTECIKVIDEFLREEHLLSPHVHVKAQRYDLVEKLKVVLDKIKEIAPEKKIRLRADSAHLFITGDSVKFFQIAHNILSNAVKFTGSNGEIDVVVKNLESSVEFSVRDNGIGIPSALHPYVFEKNTRAARPGLKGEISNGIGLYVVHKLVGLMGGRISFNSREGEGTRFVIELPKVPA